MASADRRCFFYGHEIQKVAESKSEAEKIKELDVIKINEEAKELVKQRLGEVGRFQFLGISLKRSVGSAGSICASRERKGGGGIGLFSKSLLYGLTRSTLSQILFGMLHAPPA